MVLIALVVSEALRVSLAAWLGTVWVVFAWFWMARTKTVSWRLVSGVFAVAMPWAGVVGWLSLRVVAAASVTTTAPAAAIVVAGAVEEVCKLAPLVILALLAPGRVRRLLVCDWLVLGVAAGAGFAAVEEGLRRFVYLSEPTTPGMTLATAMCPREPSKMVECLELPTFGFSPFSPSFSAVLSYGGHAMVTGMVVACVGLARHLWWRCGGGGGGRSGPGGAVGRVLAPLLPLLALWVAVVDHTGHNASMKGGAWSQTGGEAPWTAMGITSALAGGGHGRGWLMVILLVVGSVLDARVLCTGLYDDGLLDDLGVREGRVGGGVIGARRWRILAGLPRSGAGRGLADIVDALVLPWLEWRLVVRAAGAGRALHRFRLPICTVVGLRREREAAARAVLDPGRSYRWVVRLLAGLALLTAIPILARVPGITRDLNGELAPSIWRSWLAGILDMFGNLWNSMTPADQGLLMVTAGALIVLSGGTLGVAFEVGMGMALLGSAHDAARFVRDPKGTAAGYVSSHTPAEMVLDAAAWVAAMAGVFGGVARYGRQAAQESRRWNQAEKAARGMAGPRAAHADPRRGDPDNGAMWRTQQGGGYGGGRRKAQPEPKPDIDPRDGVNRGDGHDHRGKWAEKNKGSHAYEPSEWQGAEQYRKRMEQQGHPLQEIVNEKRAARINGTGRTRFYDRFVLTEDGTWEGLEVKSGGGHYEPSQRAFDAQVSPDNPAYVTLSDGRTIKITNVRVINVPKQEFPTEP